LARASLKEWRTKCPSTAWIFPALNGTPKALQGQTVDEYFGDLTERAGVRRRRAYDLRHTAITVAVTNAIRSCKVNLKDVARSAGHRRTSTMLEIYTSAIASSAAMAEVMELGGTSAVSFLASESCSTGPLADASF
jgi:integrase